jgi:hypothetical protein
VFCTTREKLFLGSFSFRPPNFFAAYSGASPRLHADAASAARSLARPLVRVPRSQILFWKEGRKCLSGAAA